MVASQTKAYTIDTSYNSNFPYGFAHQASTHIYSGHLDIFTNYGAEVAAVANTGDI